MKKPAIKQSTIRQAILTKYFGPTDTRGSRIKATADAGTVYVSWDYALNSERNHAAAAAKLCDKFGWNTQDFGPMVQGALPGGGYAFVEAPRAVDAIHEALGNLIQLMTGNRGNRAGNPYSKPEVQRALNALYYAAHGHTPDNPSDALNAADAWRGKQYKVTLRALNGTYSKTETLTISETADTELEAARYAASYGFSVEKIEAI